MTSCERPWTCSEELARRAPMDGTMRVQATQLYVSPTTLRRLVMSHLKSPCQAGKGVDTHKAVTATRSLKIFLRHRGHKAF